MYDTSLKLQMSYDGDVDQASQSQLEGGLGLRATVDGDARRRKYSSDEEESVKELSRTQESHLQSYQQSTPMQPGMCCTLEANITTVKPSPSPSFCSYECKHNA